MTSETLNLIMGVSNLLIAALVPFLSIIVAQRLVRRDAKVQQVKDALLRVRRDTQDYRTAYLARHPDVWASLPQELRIAHQRDLLNAVATLDEDCFLIGLICEKKGDELGRRVRALADWAHILFGKPCEDGQIYPIQPYDFCQQKINEQIMEICKRMEPLQRHIESQPLFPTLTKLWATLCSWRRGQEPPASVPHVCAESPSTPTKSSPMRKGK